MKKIIVSLAAIVVVAVIAVGGTIAYFSDAETSGVNTFTAGTIDISVTGTNGAWSDGFALEDMKPCYTDYINFKITNDGNNPVDIVKKLVFADEEDAVYGETGKENGINEPECKAYGGTWENSECVCGDDCISVNDIENQIIYDLTVEVYDENNERIWWQTIYEDSNNKTINEIYGGGENQGVYLGMIPVGHYMLVSQSYHMKDTGEPQNQYQSDQLAFTIEIEAKQLTGTAVLENKKGFEPWALVLDDGIQGTLTYNVMGPRFKFDFTGKAPLADTEYVLAAGYDIETNVDTFLGEEVTDSDGNIYFSGSIELGKHLKNVKVWLVPKEYWEAETESVKWNGWPGIGEKFLWETGLIWYADTDL